MGTELRESFRELINLEHLRDNLAEQNPNAFEDISLVSYPEAWEANKYPGPEEKKPQSLDEIEPFDADWTEFDHKFQGLWHLIATENTEPLPKEYLPENDTGYRDLYGPPEDLDKVKLPSIYCKRAQPTRLPRNPKQRLPFPVWPIEEEPMLDIKPWMLKPTPPTINWKKQKYQGIFDDTLIPKLIRWEEYPEYDEDEAEAYRMANPPPTLKEIFMPYTKNTKNTKGLGCDIKVEEEPMSPDELQDFFDQKQKDEEFDRLMLGDLPDHWFSQEQNTEVKDFGDSEQVGRRLEEHDTRPSKKVNPFMINREPVRDFNEDNRRDWSGRGRGGGRKWRSEWREDDGDGKGYKPYAEREEGDGWRGGGGWKGGDGWKGGGGWRGGDGGGGWKGGDGNKGGGGWKEGDGGGGWKGGDGGGGWKGGDRGGGWRGGEGGDGWKGGIGRRPLDEGDKGKGEGTIGKMNKDWSSQKGASNSGWMKSKLEGKPPSTQKPKEK